MDIAISFKALAFICQALALMTLEKLLITLDVFFRIL